MDAEKENSKITFRVPVELHRRFKIAAIKDGRKMEELLASMVEAWTRKKEESNG